jgi:homoserine dehydrogenase
MHNVQPISSIHISAPWRKTEVRVGIVGYGTVGRATAEMLSQNANEIRSRTNGVSIQLRKVCRRSPDSAIGGAELVRDWKQVVEADDVDIVVEAIGGTDTAYDVVRSSLENGKAVVTANKALLARFGDELFAVAQQNQLPIGIEASVCGGVPVIRAISEALSGDRIQAVYGIVNGTCNFILSQMESSAVEFSDALRQAQAAGYAEADPTLDIDGFDARDKISILARLAFNTPVPLNAIPTTGIRQVRATDFHYAERLSSTIRLVAAAESTSDGPCISVRPWLVQRDSMLGKVYGPNNAVMIVGEKVGTQMLYGRGAGGGATGAAVVSDVIQIATQMARGQAFPNLLSGFRGGAEFHIARHSRPVSWYLRLTVADRPGILARVAEVIAREGINIDSVFQEPHMAKERLSFVITLEPVEEAMLLRAVESIDRFDFMVEPTLVLPMVSGVGE